MKNKFTHEQVLIASVCHLASLLCEAKIGRYPSEEETILLVGGIFGTLQETLGSLPDAKLAELLAHYDAIAAAAEAAMQTPEATR